MAIFFKTIHHRDRGNAVFFSSVIPSGKQDFHSKLFEEKVFRLSAPDHMLWLQLRQGQCEVVTDRRKTHANEASLDKSMPHRGAAARPTGVLARRSHMPLPLRHLSLLRPFYFYRNPCQSLPTTPGVPASKMFILNLSRKRCFGCLCPFAMHMGASQTCCGVVFVNRKMFMISIACHWLSVLFSCFILCVQ